MLTWGLEIEAENVIRSYYKLPHGWGITDDGSLRNWGAEFVSPILRSKYQVKRHLILLLKQMREHNAVFSYRTGIHVHVGTFTEEHAFPIIEAYLKYERMLFELFPSRESNNFCIPLLETNGSFAYFLGRSIGERDPSYAKQEWSKYLALNIFPLGTLGTVEFRMLEGTFDKELLFKAIDIIESIMMMATGQEPKIKPRKEHEEEAKEFLAMCKHVAYEPYGEPPYTEEAIRKLFGLPNEPVVEEEYIDEILREMEEMPCVS